MPRPLLVPTVKVTWRIEADDFTLLNSMFPSGRLNPVVRRMLHDFCEKERARRAEAAES